MIKPSFVPHPAKICHRDNNTINNNKKALTHAIRKQNEESIFPYLNHAYLFTTLII
jgi:hypothetical protein